MQTNKTWVLRREEKWQTKQQKLQSQVASLLSISNCCSYRQSRIDNNDNTSNFFFGKKKRVKFKKRTNSAQKNNFNKLLTKKIHIFSSPGKNTFNIHPNEYNSNEWYFVRFPTNDNKALEIVKSRKKREALGFGERRTKITVSFKANSALSLLPRTGLQVDLAGFGDRRGRD